jgi:ribosomal protein L29
MSKTEYLYGTENIEHIPDEFIEYRIQKLNEHLKKLLNVHYLKRDIGRVNKVIKAIEFWKNIKDN